MRQTRCVRISLAWIMTVLLLFYAPLTVCADSAHTEQMQVIIHDTDKNDRIDALFRLRNELELDYEANETRISWIDRELVSLGVEMLSYEEVRANIGGDALPLFDVSSTSTTQWTSRRVVVTFYGQHFELQILEGVPLSAASPLREDYLYVEYEAAGFAAGVDNALKVLAVAGGGSEPLVGSVLATGVSLLTLLADIGHELVDSLTSSTTIDNVQGSATVSFTTHMKYILVKPYETPDYGNQATCYVGTAVTYRITTVSILDVFINGALYTEHGVSANVTDTVTSQYYDDYEFPCRNYYNYRYHGIDFNENYWIYSIDLNIFWNRRTFRVPYELP